MLGARLLPAGQPGAVATRNIQQLAVESKNSAAAGTASDRHTYGLHYSYIFPSTSSSILHVNNSLLQLPKVHQYTWL